MGGFVCKFDEGIINQGNSKVSLFKKVMEHLFGVKSKYEGEGNELIVDFAKLCLNSLSGESIKEGIDEEYIMKSENWLITNNDERAVGYEHLPKSEYVFNYQSDPGMYKIKEVEKKCAISLRIFFYHKVEKNYEKNAHEVDGFYSNKVYYQDTDSLNVHMDFCE